MVTKTETNKKITFEEMEKVEEQLTECAKNDKPIENIICPRCGAEIIFTEIGNSYTVECETFNCIKYGVRGI